MMKTNKFISNFYKKCKLSDLFRQDIFEDKKNFGMELMNQVILNLNEDEMEMNEDFFQYGISFIPFLKRIEHNHDYYCLGNRILNKFKKRIYSIYISEKETCNKIYIHEYKVEKNACPLKIKKSFKKAINQIYTNGNLRAMIEINKEKNYGNILIARGIVFFEKNNVWDVNIEEEYHNIEDLNDQFLRELENKNY